jgi:hypothetical protein
MRMVKDGGSHYFSVLFSVKSGVIFAICPRCYYNMALFGSGQG